MQDPSQAAPQAPFRLAPSAALFNLGPSSPSYPVLAPRVAPRAPAPAPLPESRIRLGTRLRPALMFAGWVVVGAVSVRLLWSGPEPLQGATAPPPSQAVPAAPMREPILPNEIAGRSAALTEPDPETVTATILAMLDPPELKPAVEPSGGATTEAAVLSLLQALPAAVPVESLEDIADAALTTHAELPQLSDDDAQAAVVAAILAARAEAAEPSATASESPPVAAKSDEVEGSTLLAAILAALEPASGELVADARDDDDEPPTPDSVPVPHVAAFVAADIAADADPARVSDEFTHETILATLLEAAERTASAHAAEPPSTAEVNAAIIAEILAALGQPNIAIAATPVIHATSADVLTIIAADAILVPPIASGDTTAMHALDRAAVVHATEPPAAPSIQALVDAILMAATPAGDGEPGPVIAQLQQTAPAIPAPQPPAAPNAPSAPATDAAAQSARFLTRGDELIEIGDVAAARLFYERAARAGNAQAMIALARTYDPEILRQRGVVGLTADPARAKFWYDKAAAAGAAGPAPKSP